MKIRRSGPELTAEFRRSTIGLAYILGAEIITEADFINQYVSHDKENHITVSVNAANEVVVDAMDTLMLIENDPELKKDLEKFKEFGKKYVVEDEKAFKESKLKYFTSVRPIARVLEGIEYIRIKNRAARKLFPSVF